MRDTFSPCWMLNEAYQGKGYAFEAAQAFFDYLFSQKGARRIYAYTEDYNLSSQHLCEKLGMRREGMFLEFISFVNNPDGTPRYENTVQYAILKKSGIAASGLIDPIPPAEHPRMSAGSNLCLCMLKTAMPDVPI